MAQKNDTTALILAFLVTAGLIGGGFWWFTHQSGSDLNKILSTVTKAPSGSTDGESPSGSTATSNPNLQGNPSTGEGFASVPKVPQVYSVMAVARLGHPFD